MTTDSESQPQQSWWGRWRPAVAVGLMFGTNGAIIAGLLPWYPTIKAHWGLSDATFGLMVAAIAAGSLASAALPSWVERKLGPRRAVLLGTYALALLLVSAGGVSTPWALAIVLALYGVCDAIVDVSQNVAGVKVQQAMGRSIISSLHACWSLGGVLGGLTSTAAAQAGVDMQVCFAIFALVTGVLISLACFWLGPIARSTENVTLETAPAESSPGSSSRRSSSRLGLVLWRSLPVALVAGASVVVEEVGSNWAALAAVEFAGVALSSAGIAYAVVLAAQTVGRFSGDVLIDRWGRVRVARVGGFLIALGGVVVVLSSHPLPLYIGFALAGYGCATLVPSAYAASAGIPGLHPSEGVTAVSWLMRLSMLVISPLIGLVSEIRHLRVGLGVLALSGILVVATAGMLRPRR